MFEGKEDSRTKGQNFSLTTLLLLDFGNFGLRLVLLFSPGPFLCNMSRIVEKASSVARTIG